MPIIRRQRQSPNVLGLLQIDSAVSRVVWIDIHDVGYNPFVCEEDMNPDFHAYAQCDGSQNQGTMEIDDDCLAVAGQRFADTQSLHPNLQTNPGAPSGFTSNWLGGHMPPTYASLMTATNKVPRANDTRFLGQSVPMAIDPAAISANPATTTTCAEATEYRVLILAELKAGILVTT